MDPRLRAMLIRDEGRRLKPYRDTVGKLTIGVGRNLDDVGLHADEVDLLLENDVREREESLSRFPWYLAMDEVRRAAILDLSFMGIPRLLGFHRMVTALDQQDWERAARELLDSVYATQVGARAERLAKQLRTGQWQL